MSEHEFGRCKLCGEKNQLLTLLVGFNRATSNVVAVKACRKCEETIKKIQEGKKKC